jgi:O-antigen/teichoic acid export membrane protein
LTVVSCRAQRGRKRGDQRPQGKMLAKNILYNSVGLAAPVMLALLCIPPLIKGLGMPAFGLLTLVWVVLGYFSIFDLGIGRALTLAVSSKRATGDTANIRPLVKAGLGLTLLLGAAGGGLLALAAPHLARLMSPADATLMAEAQSALYAVAAVLPFVTTTAALRGVLEAYDRFDITSAIRLGMGFITYGGPLLVLQFTPGLVPVVVFLACGRGVTWLIHLVYVRRVVPVVQGASQRITVAELRPLLVSGGWMTVSNIVSPLMSYLDRFVVAYIVGAGLTAYYTTPYEAISRLTMIPEAVLGVLFPALGAAMATDRERAKQLYGQSLRVLLAVMVPVATALVAFAHPLLSAWIDADFARQSFLAMQWLAVGVSVNCVARVTFTVIQSQNRADVTAKLHLIELPCFLLLLFWLTHSLGIAGAAMAWCIRACVDFAMLLHIQQRLLPTELRVRWYTTATIAGVLLGAGTVQWMGYSVWAPIAGLAATLAALVVSMILVLQPEDRALVRAAGAAAWQKFRRS